MNTLHELLKKHWGRTSFLPHQEEIIRSVLEGNDTLAILATGGGKSLCYQLPALRLGGLTLVISPLISLMKDQIDSLNARRIPAAAYNSTLGFWDRSKIDEELAAGELRLLFVSPERCVQPNFLDSLANVGLRLIAIDEAHCISEWGHNFRPEYRQLARLKRCFPGVPVIALTATAVKDVRADIVRQLGLSHPRKFVGSFNRKNIEYRVIPKKNPLQFLATFIGQHRDDAGIVYCLSKKETEEIARELRRWGFSALAYHAGLSAKTREKVQDGFIKGTVRVVCATVAFGMGIDKPDVRYVIHYDLPKSIESYYQETGRAGRDGKFCECVLLFSRVDSGRIRWMLERDGNGGQVKRALCKLQEMVDYCESTGCRRRFLLRYFDESLEEENCGSCDTCTDPRQEIDGTVQAQMIAACVQQLPAKFGIEIISGVLRGARAKRIHELGLDALPVYGSGKKFSREEYRTWIADLIRQGCLARSGDEYPVISLTAEGFRLLHGRDRIMLPGPVTAEQGWRSAPDSVSRPELPPRLCTGEADPAGVDDETLFL
ncbi:MAG: ATP-dependent RNA helicase DeaD [Methanoregula sp. SKADARSKE-2]|nr:MAG: ATP-dependent RNA helicase DeaD [Methanoregula sp. SKADARSKE-2]